MSPEPRLDLDERARLLEIARRAGLRETPSPGSEPAGGGRAPAEPRPVFVTWRLDGEEIGCRGSTVPSRPLDAEVAHHARRALPASVGLDPAKRARLTAEVTLLGPLEPLASAPSGIVPGLHGIAVVERKRGLRRVHRPRVGVVLPGAAAAAGLDATALLSLALSKAGLAEDDLRGPRRRAIALRFEAEAIAG